MTTAAVFIFISAAAPPAVSRTTMPDLTADLNPVEESLARELAEALGDQASLDLYRAYVLAYPDVLLRRALAEARSVPQERIKKSRGALFTYLVRKYARRSDDRRH